MGINTCYAPAEEPYFMSDEQKDAVIGSTVRQRTEAKQHLATLRMEATRLGTIFSEVGRMLHTTPEFVGFERQPINVIYSSNHSPVFKLEDFNGAAVLKLTNEIRGTMDNISLLEASLSNLGIKLSD